MTIKIKEILADKHVLVMLIVNLYPIIGVLFFEWDFMTIIMLYLVETFTVGIINIFKILKSKGKPQSIKAETELKYINPKPKRTRVAWATFFGLHYNLFFVFQVVFLFAVIIDKRFDYNDYINFDFISGIISMIVNHVNSYYKNYIGKKQYVTASAEVLMFTPYKRVLITQVTAIFGGFLIMIFNAPVFLLIILILMKTFFDIATYLMSRNIDSLNMDVLKPYLMKIKDKLEKMNDANKELQKRR